MGGVMQWLREKILPIGKWRVFAIFLAGSVAFGAVDSADLFLPTKWITHNMQILGWVQFIAYWLVYAVALWLFVSFAWWVCKNAGQWAKRMMKWLHNKIPLKFRSWRSKFIPFIQQAQQMHEKILQWADRMIIPYVLIGVLALFIWLAYHTFPDLEAFSDMEAMPKDKADWALELLKFYAYVIGGIILIFQVRISNRRATAMERTADLGEKGNITERFKNAIEHLGKKSESIRMGGVYGLYHVARESREYVDTVLKILCAHAKSVMAESGYADKKKPPNEIMAILDILSSATFVEGNKNTKIFKKVDISGWDLHGADVSALNMEFISGLKVNLSSATLSKVNLSGAKLSGANLSGAKLLRTNLSNATLSEINLSGARLLRPNLSGARLLKANLSGAKFFLANLSGAKLLRADLSGASLPNANLSGAHLFKANLPEAFLWRANLSNGDLSGANLSGANLSGAKLSGANLSGAKLSGAILSGAKLSGANLSGAKLSGASVSEKGLLRTFLNKDRQTECLVLGTLLEAKNLHKAKLDDHIREEILRRKPELLDPPADSPDEEE